MKLDLYVQSSVQNVDTGEIKKTWNYHKTMACSAKGVVSNSTSTRANDTQKFNNRYVNEQMIQIRTSERLNLRYKITNIRTAKGDPIWVEIDYPTETPTVFEVVGITPITDPFGTILAFNTIAKRSENQTIDF